MKITIQNRSRTCLDASMLVFVLILRLGRFALRSWTDLWFRKWETTPAELKVLKRFLWWDSTPGKHRTLTGCLLSALSHRPLGRLIGSFVYFRPRVLKPYFPAPDPNPNFRPRSPKPYFPAPGLFKTGRGRVSMHLGCLLHRVCMWKW